MDKEEFRNKQMGKYTKLAQSNQSIPSKGKIIAKTSDLFKYIFISILGVLFVFFLYSTISLYVFHEKYYPAYETMIKVFESSGYDESTYNSIFQDLQISDNGYTIEAIQNYDTLFLTLISITLGILLLLVLLLLVPRIIKKRRGLMK